MGSVFFEVQYISNGKFKTLSHSEDYPFALDVYNNYNESEKGTILRIVDNLGVVLVTNE